MKRVLVILAAMVCLCGCLNEKDYAENAIDPSLIIGSWSESYEIYPYLAWDGGAAYTFNEDGSYLLEAYNVEAGHSSYTYNYTISDGVITTITPYGSTNYKIVRLDRYMMEWQKVGTEFSEGTLISDYKRFKRKN